MRGGLLILEVMKAEVIRRIKLEGVPSASGLARVPGGYLIGCDDSPWVFRIDGEGKVLEKKRIFEGEGPRIPKPIKPDIEALAALGEEDGILMLGSGSKIPERTGIVLLRPFGEPEYYAAEGFYRAVIEACGMAAEDLNIEGASCVGWELSLLNRGGNRLIRLNAGELLQHLRSGGPMPKLRVSQYVLPQNGAYQAGFSGAAAGPDGHMLFCASVEATANWIDDGEVLGSYVGLLDPDGGKENAQCVMVMENGVAFKGKIEAIEATGIKGEDWWEVLTVTDDDAGGSELVWVRMGRF